jgi:glycosyltransferase involved in cell wall biosynthesis
MEMLPGYRGPVEVVPNGVDCGRNRPGAAPRRPGALVFNGALTYGANYDAMRWFLAQVYPRVREQVPHASLTITGSLQGVDLSGLALNPSVRFSGYVEDVRPLVAGAELCVVPIRQGGGTRLKILEAMALGTPVVATPKGAEGLEVADGEHLAVADDPAAFAARTVALLCDPALRERLATAARCRVEERYDWRPIGARFVELVERTVERHGGKT